ncbi:MAG: hypothetical protein DRH34_03100 [Deltaproteobacteria bacterium]|nr:MAG: hypothetical protein DRH34_03100 [Deltaproteobacteria bacterium]
MLKKYEDKNMKCYFVLIACLLYILSASSISAEYYHYIDKDGIKHYTDDISEIPEDQRPKLSIHKSIQTPAKKEAPPENPAISPESLVIKKDELDNEYEALVKKREALNKEKKSIGEKKYNEIATQLNIEIKQYQKKSQSYEKLVEQYNEQIKPSDKN